MNDTFTTFQEFRIRYPMQVTKDTLLGSGSYGKVIRVEDQVETEWVAVKICEFKGDDTKSLLAEVELARRIPRNTNIARYDACYRLETDTGISDFAIMKYYPDGNLADLLRKNTLTPEQIYDLTKGILQGLKHLHIHRIVHRDFKPANILISRDNRGRLIPKIADFGLSKLVSEDEIDSSDFDLSDGRGTASYKAPEQIEGGKVSFNLDLWAFGVILFELLTQKKPFSADGQAGSEQAIKRQIEMKIVSVAIPPQIQHIPEPYQAMIRRCLIKDIHKRVRKEDELLDLLDEIPQLLSTADTLAQAGQFAEAIAVYETILAKRERHPHAQKGIKQCRDGIEQARLDALLQEGNTLTANRQYEAAIAIYEQVLADAPTHKQAIEQLGIAQSALAKQQKIASLQAQALDLLNKQAFREAKTAFLELQHLAPTLDGLQTGLTACETGLRQQQVDQLWQQASSFFLQADFDRARQQYEAILQLDPNHQEAIQQLQACKEGIRQQHISQLLATGNGFLAKQQYNNAIARYQAVLALDAANTQAHQQIRACKEAQQAQAINDLLKQANGHFQKKQYGRAREVYQQILTVDSKQPQAQQQLEACNEAERQLQLQAWQKQANDLLKRRKFAEAQALFQQILMADAGNETAQKGVLACLEALKPAPAPEETTDLFTPNSAEPATDVYVAPVQPTPLTGQWASLARKALPYAAGAILLAGGIKLFYAYQPTPEPLHKTQPAEAAVDTSEVQNTRVAEKEKPQPLQPVKAPETATASTTNIALQNHDKAIAQARRAYNRQNWAAALTYLKQALTALPGSSVALRLQTDVRQAQQQQIADNIRLAEEQRQQQLLAERETQRRQTQQEYNDLIDKAVAAINTSNNKAQAMSLFAKAASLANTNQLSTTKAETAYSLYVEKGNRLFKLEEYAGAKDWFRVAQSIRNTAEVRTKIKECDANL